jgi:hypothetical protein
MLYAGMMVYICRRKCLVDVLGKKNHQKKEPVDQADHPVRMPNLRIDGHHQEQQQIVLPNHHRILRDSL